MYSKTFCFATLLAAVLCASACTVGTPWRDEPVGQEINIVFSLRNNLLYLPTVTVDGRHGAFLMGSAQPASVLNTAFPNAAEHALQLNARETLPFTAVRGDLQGVADAIIGSDVWRGSAVTIDYRAGLITLQREGIHPELMTVYRYADEPMINVIVDGKSIPAVVDTTLPDTIALPGTNPGRRTARVRLAEVDFGAIDVRIGDVQVARVGNRLLSKFLVSIDYGRRVVGLWRDPRIPTNDLNRR